MHHSGNLRFAEDLCDLMATIFYTAPYVLHTEQYLLHFI